MQMHVKTFSGKTIAVEYDENQTWGELKEWIARRYSEHPVTTQQIIIAGRIMNVILKIILTGASAQFI